MKYYTPTKLSENIHETPEGFLLCLGVPIARTGEMVYGEGETPLEADDEGKVLIYRDADDVFHMDAITSFEGKAVTINHPEDFVSPDNWSYLAKGVVQNVRRGIGEEADCLLADLLITDALAISLVKNGLREVSCGYEAEYNQTGEGKGTQSGIVGNHIALVKQGRAGPSHAIKDHKGEGSTMSKLAENMKKLFAKAVDEAEASEKKETEKKPAAKDEAEGEATGLAAVMKMLQALSEKVEELAKGKPEAASADEEMEKKPAKKEEKKKAEKSDDAEEEGEKSEASLEERLKALETAVAKLLEDEDSEEESEDEEGEKSEDEDEESEDDDFEKSSKTGDTASRAEILSPGIKHTKGVDLKIKALEAAYQTKEGKAVIHSLTGGKKPVFDSAERVANLFVATSEIMKATRGNGLEKTKRAYDSGEATTEAMTPEKMNEINAQYWAKK